MIPDSLLANYLRTSYLVYLSPELAPLRIRIGEHLTALDALCKSWVFITAANPGSDRLTREENAERIRSLQAELSALRLACYPGEGKADDSEWVEESFLVLDISLDAALELARRHGQLAIVAGQQGSAAELIEVSGSQK